MNTPTSHVLLDIEGTTCPVRFVSETLFPYAADRLPIFLEARAQERDVQELLAQVEQAWRNDPDPQAQALRPDTDPKDSLSNAVLPYLQWLIHQDRKLTPLKELQGLIWEEGYASGALQGPLYPDVAPALRRWQSAGLRLAVYSSGSVKAQQLIYRYSRDGDLRKFFEHWFDTRIGPKLEPGSYGRIGHELGIAYERILFISDSPAELRAASRCGTRVLLCNRPEDGPTDNPTGEFPIIHTFDDLDPCSWG